MALAIIFYVIVMVCVLVGMAFLTLLERRVLGYIQLRRGPNVVGVFGIMQPFADAVKLFRREQFFPTLSNFYPYYFAPVFSLMLSLLV